MRGLQGDRHFRTEPSGKPGRGERAPKSPNPPLRVDSSRLPRDASRAGGAMRLRFQRPGRGQRLRQEVEVFASHLASQRRQAAAGSTRFASRRRSFSSSKRALSARVDPRRRRAKTGQTGAGRAPQQAFQAWGCVGELRTREKRRFKVARQVWHCSEEASRGERPQRRQAARARCRPCRRARKRRIRGSSEGDSDPLSSSRCFVLVVLGSECCWDVLSGVGVWARSFPKDP